MLDAALKSKIEAEFGLPLSNGYGITECAPAIASVGVPRSDDAVGSLITGIEARLVAPAAAPLHRARSAGCTSADRMSCAAITGP